MPKTGKEMVKFLLRQGIEREILKQVGLRN